MMTRLSAVVASRTALVLSLLAAGTGCDVHEPIVIPAGAQVVHLTATDDEVQVDPASVAAGEVYVVLEGPKPTIYLVSNQSGPDSDPRGMTPAELARLADGDMQFTLTDAFAVTCGFDAWTEDRHWEGCGENVRLTLAPGFHAFVASDEVPGVRPVMAVLEVRP